MLNVFIKLRLSLLSFDPTEEASGIAGETFWKSLCLMTGERGIMENIDTRSASLKEYLRRKYGANMQKVVDTYGKESERAARFSNDHHFNLRCFKSGIVPPGLRIYSPVNSDRARAAALRTSRIFMQERIRTSLKARDSASSRTAAARSILSDNLSKEDFEKVDRICKRSTESTFARFKERQRKKFEKLRNAKLATSTLEGGSNKAKNTWVVNLSDHQLTEEETSVLEKGPKFAITPRVNRTDIIAPIEAALQISLASDQAKELARIRICEALRKTWKPRNNFTAAERKAKRDLKENKDIRVLNVDKGNAMVVMNAKDYKGKANTLLEDRSSYSVLRKDPTRKTERSLLRMLRKLRKEEKISEKMYNRVKPSEGSSKPALFYGRVKLHKLGAPLRPVVSTCGTSTYELARELSDLLRPLVTTSERILKNTMDMVEVFEDVVVDEDEVLVSFDVKSLFTSIPVEEAIEICKGRLLEDSSLEERTDLSVDTIVNLLRFCLTSMSFQFDGKHYQQTNGVAMGSPVSPVVADIFMIDLENKAFASCAPQMTPRIWYRFVDDIISIVKRKHASQLLEHLNLVNDRIQFTMETEEDGSLPMMDVRFTREKNGKLRRQVYQKQTHTNRYIQFSIFITPSHGREVRYHSWTGRSSTASKQQPETCE